MTQTHDNSTFTLELSNNCMCAGYYCPSCEEWTDDSTSTPDTDHSHWCDDCGAILTEAYELCSGECFTSTIEVLNDTLSQIFPDEHWRYFYVQGSNMGWRNLEGTLVFDRDETDFWEAIAPERTEWNQSWTLPDLSNSSLPSPHTSPSPFTVTCTQSHHDSPTGETYTFRPATDAEIDRWF